jgi:biotin transport system substrate-specific component
VCGPRAAVIASVAYITVGLLYLPIFHSGGSFSYVTTPGFGYLIGFVPTAWISGRLAYRRNMNNLISLTLCSVIGLILLQIWGVIYIIIGSLVGDWALNLPDLVYSYSIAPLPAQLLLCPGVGIASLTLRQLLFIE